MEADEETLQVRVSCVCSWFWLLSQVFCVVHQSDWANCREITGTREPPPNCKTPQQVDEEVARLTR